MQFKLVHFIKNFGISFSPDEELLFNFDDAQKTSVMIREIREKEKELIKERDSDVLYCEAKREQEINNDFTDVFNRLAKNLMPEGFKKPKPKPPFNSDNYPNVDEKGWIEENTIPSISLFSKGFQELEEQIRLGLWDSINKTLKTVRWKLGSNKAYNPILFTSGLYWSFDGKKWCAMPLDVHIELNLEKLHRIYGKLYEIIENLIKRQELEPLGHELFLEAWAERTSNPRSALVLGMSAAEVGLKQCISKLVPDAEWLADNLPSPPLDKMIANYLPLLPTKLKIQGRVLSPPKRIRKTIQEGIVLRNKTAHVGNNAPPKSILEETLLSVRDLLYLLDFYCGYDWAIKNVRRETLEAMKQEYNL